MDRRGARSTIEDYGGAAVIAPPPGDATIGAMKHKALFLLLPYLLSALACSLTEPPTPTFVLPATESPVSTDTPMHTTPAASTPSPSPEATAFDAASYLSEVDNDRLLISVDTLQNFNTRFVHADPNSPTRGIGGARTWIIGQFEQIQEEARAAGVPFVIQLHNFQLEWQGLVTTQTNVVAYLPGSGSRVNEVIIVGAHYDSISEYADATSPAPGADDNASGVAVMLECARIMAQRQHRATVVFAAFSAEETGRQGSQAFLTDVVQGDDLNVRAMINLDMVGAQQLPDGSLLADQVRLFSAPPNESDSRHLARTVQMVVARYMPDFAVKMQPTVDRAGRWGDHMTFSEAGYPAVRLIEAAEDPERSNSTRDTMDRVSAGYMARVTRVVLATLQVLADGPPPPTGIDMADGTLTWTPVANAAGYIIALRRADSLAYDRWIEVETANSFTPPANEDIFGGMSYLAIAAIDAGGQQGPFSIEIPLVR